MSFVGSQARRWWVIAGLRSVAPPAAKVRPLCTGSALASCVAPPHQARQAAAWAPGPPSSQSWRTSAQCGSCGQDWGLWLRPGPSSRPHLARNLAHNPHPAWEIEKANRAWDTHMGLHVLWPWPDSSSELRLANKETGLSVHCRLLLGPIPIPQSLTHNLRGGEGRKARTLTVFNFPPSLPPQSRLESQSQTPAPPPHPHLRWLLPSPGPRREGNKSQRWPHFDVFWVKAEGVIDLGARQDRTTGWDPPGRPSLERQMCV